MFLRGMLSSLFLLSLLLSSSANNDSVLPSEAETTTSHGLAEDVKGEGPGRLEDFKQSFMVGWYRMTEGFLGLVEVDVMKLVDDVVDVVNSTRGVNGTGGHPFNQDDYREAITRVMKRSTGLMVCLFIGLLYVVVMFFALILVPCCRICCNLCGGKRTQVITENTGKWRVVNVVILLVVCGVLTASCVSMLVSSYTLRKAVNNATYSITEAMSTTADYIDSLDQELEEINEDPLKNVKDAIFSQSDGIKKKTLREVIDYIGLDQLNIPEIESALDGVVRDVNGSEVSLSDLKEKIGDTKTAADKLEDACSEEGAQWCDQISTDFDEAALDIDLDTSSADKAKSSLQNVQEEIQSVKDHFDNEYEGFVEKSSVVIDAKSNDIKKVVVSVQETIERLSGNFRSASADNSSSSRQFHEAVGYATDIWAGLLGIALLPTVLTVGLLVGLVCGACGHKNSREPDERKSLSRQGGLCLLASVYFFLPFAFILMLITMTLFLGGGMAYLYGCKFVQTDRIEEIDTIIETFQNKTGTLSDGFTRNFRPGAIMKKCEQNKALMDVVDVKQFNLGDLDELQKEVDESIEEEKQKIDINIKYGEIKRKINGLDVNPAPLEEEVQKAKEAIVPVRERLEKAVDEAKAIDEQVDEGNLRQVFDNYTKSLHGSLAALDKLQTSLGTLNTSVGVVKAYAENLQAVTTQIEEKLKPEINAEVKQILLRNLGNFSIDVEDVKRTMFGEVGRCRPLYDALSVVITYSCDLVTEPVNGYWAGLGACLLFFIPALIVAMKLSKHYLKVKPIYRVDGHYGRRLPSDGVEMDHVRVNGKILHQPHGGYQNGGYKSDSPRRYQH